MTDREKEILLAMPPEPKRERLSHEDYRKHICEATGISADVVGSVLDEFLSYVYENIKLGNIISLGNIGVIAYTFNKPRLHYDIGRTHAAIFTPAHDVVKLLTDNTLRKQVFNNSAVMPDIELPSGIGTGGSYVRNRWTRLYK